MVKTKKIVIWIIVAVLVISLVIGSLFLFNSNEWRFRMGALTGEYINTYTIGESFYTVSVSLYEMNGNDYVQRNDIGGCRYDNGELAVMSKYLSPQATTYPTDYLDKNVTDILKYYTKMLSNNCNVHKDGIDFVPLQKTLTVTNSVLRDKDEWGNFVTPKREVVLSDTDASLLCVFNADYIKDGDYSKLYLIIDSFDVSIDNIDIVGADGKQYRLSLSAHFFEVEDAEELLRQRKEYEKRNNKALCKMENE